MKNSLRKFLSLLIWDFKLQYRYYFFAVAIVLTSMWLLIFFALTEEASILWIPVLIFADICNMGLLFIAGILFLERSQGTLVVAATMPVSNGIWLAVKLTSLTVLGTACGISIVFFNVESINWIRVILAIVLNAALFAGLGFAMACPFKSIMNYFLIMAVGLSVLNIPILSYLGIYHHALMWLLPSQPALYLLAGSLQEMSSISFYTAALLLIAWIGLIQWFGIKLFRKSIAQS